jgi:two-component system chemotaxis sensor kinase CheA
MSLSAEIRKQLVSSFHADLAEHVQSMTDGLLALEEGQQAGEERQATLVDIFRSAHSLKGAARAVGVTAVEQLAHALEEVLTGMQREMVELTPELFSACFQSLDALQAVQTAYDVGTTSPPIQALEAIVSLEPFQGWRTFPAAENPAPSESAAQSTPAESSAPPAPRQKAFSAPGSTNGKNRIPADAARPAEETIRVSVHKLDALMAQLSELLITKIRSEQRLAQVRQLQESVTQWQKEWLPARNAYGRLTQRTHELGSALGMPEPSRWPKMRPGDGLGTGMERSNGGDWGRLAKDVSLLLNYAGANQERLHQIQALVNELFREYTRDTTQTALVIDGLEEDIKRVRMLPFSTITGPFARMVRDLAQDLGKEVILQIVGNETELDKRVLEQIKDPLVHLLRNAVDHGIETPAVREAKGKPASGTVTLSAEQMGNNIVISVSDDGVGLDIEEIRQALQRRGVADADSLSETELVESIYQTGVSTSPIITDISGRGIGLDVVRRNVESLHGQINQNWSSGNGTTFSLTLPLTLTSTRGLLVRVANQLFAIQFHSIVRMADIAVEEIINLEGHDAVLHEGRPLTLVRLGDVLGLPRMEVQENEGRVPYVVLAAAERRIAFAVDDLVDEQEVVIRGMGKQLSRVGGILGATSIGSGEVVLILNVPDLIKLAMSGRRNSILEATGVTKKTVEERSKRRILVVDDSITTRTLEKNILEAEGYEVQLAVDGEEALAIIASQGAPDLIVSDIIMPRMDGFELTRRIKTDEGTAHVPVILVTSLDSPEDKVLGIEAGGDAYIVKSSFDQTNLLETIEQLI